MEDSDEETIEYSIEIVESSSSSLVSSIVENPLLSSSTESLNNPQEEVEEQEKENSYDREATADEENKNSSSNDEVVTNQADDETIEIVESSSVQEEEEKEQEENKVEEEQTIEVDDLNNKQSNPNGEVEEKLLLEGEQLQFSGENETQDSGGLLCTDGTEGPDNSEVEPSTSATEAVTADGAEKKEVNVEENVIEIQLGSEEIEENDEVNPEGEIELNSLEIESGFVALVPPADANSNAEPIVVPEPTEVATLDDSKEKKEDEPKASEEAGEAIVELEAGDSKIEDNFIDLSNVEPIDEELSTKIIDEITDSLNCPVNEPQIPLVVQPEDSQPETATTNDSTENEVIIGQQQQQQQVTDSNNIDNDLEAKAPTAEEEQTKSTTVQVLIEEDPSNTTEVENSNNSNFEVDDDNNNNNNNINNNSSDDSKQPIETEVEPPSTINGQQEDVDFMSVSNERDQNCFLNPNSTIIGPMRLRTNSPVNFDEEDLEYEFDNEPLFERHQIEINRSVDPRSKYSLHNELGRGKFGTVYRCVEQSSGRNFAAKFVHMRRKEDREDVNREIEIMTLLQHKRLLQLFDAFDDGKQEMCLITELIEGGELFERIVNDDFDLTEKKAAIFMRQICEGVDYMHSLNVVHLDMKPENILCVSRTNNRIKLIDFGLARQLNNKEPLRVMFGTPDFAAPEVLAYDTVSLATDMWSVGVICYVLLSGLSPFMGDNDLETMANVNRATFDFEDEAFDPISDLAKDLISKLLVKDQSERLTANDCLKHPWLQRGGAQLEASVRDNCRRNSMAALLNLTSIAFGGLSDNQNNDQNDNANNTNNINNNNSIQQPQVVIMPSAPPLDLLIPESPPSLDKTNLKRYVIRRRWHRTVHAIMALQRMGANLKF